MLIGNRFVSLRNFFNERGGVQLSIQAKGGLVTIQEMTPEDTASLFTWQYIQEASEHDPLGYTDLRTIELGICSRLAQDNVKLFMAFVDGKAVAHSSLTEAVMPGTYELGYYVAPKERGQGYGRAIADMTSILVRDTFDQVAFVRKDNAGSSRILEQIGFVSDDHAKAQFGGMDYNNHNWSCFRRWAPGS